MYWTEKLSMSLRLSATIYSINKGNGTLPPKESINRFLLSPTLGDRLSSGD